ncbi:GMC oxidoreductase [Streptomyces sp. NPDC088387]|uniref:GMC oxidoreductase n=1 Tax=Streptomyces sp. NPDC088387 TaxID=3365859 RepID=UPI003823D4EF
MRRSPTVSTSHPAGTCRVGINDESVVDPAPHVQGITGPRIADTSIMPTLPRANTRRGDERGDERGGEHHLLIPHLLTPRQPAHTLLGKDHLTLTTGCPPRPENEERRREHP